MNKICTSLEQSKKLIKLGIDLKTADMYWHKKFDGTLSLRADNLMVKLDIPCWSLAALLDIMPDRIDDSHFLTLDKEGKEYCCCYEDINGNSFKHEFADNAIGACVEMIEKLHTENLI